MMPFPGSLSFTSAKNSLRLYKTPGWLQRFYPQRIWRFSAREKMIYLTFDDGPTEEVTPWILDTLARYHAKATFFCVGANMKRYPELVGEIERRGHTIGNHTFHHKKGNETPLDEYMNDVTRSEELHPTKLFRPPYGRLPSAHAEQLREKGFTIIMWDVLTYDFDPDISSEKLWVRMRRNIKPGSIVVFHDNVKSENHLHNLLPRALEHYSNLGYRFEPICL